MRTKKIITIVLTVIIFLTAAFLGISAVYRVEEVTLLVENVSSAALDEAAELKSVLEAEYLKKSVLTVNDDAAKTAFEKFSYFRLAGFEKDYPGRLVVTAKEDVETYAVKNGDVYRIFSSDGTYLSERDSIKNRADGTDNLVVTATEADFADSFQNSKVFVFLHSLDLLFCGIRGNVTRVELIQPTSLIEAAWLRVYFREGVQSAVYVPSERAKEKAEALYSCYTDRLTTAERTQGIIVVTKEGKAHYEQKNYLV